MFQPVSLFIDIYGQVCRQIADMISPVLCYLRFLFEYCTYIDKTTSVIFIYIDAVSRIS